MRIFRVINLIRNNFNDILHCIGWFPHGGFILVQQCCDFALYTSSTGEPVFCTLLSLFLQSFESETFSLSRWRSLANFLEQKCIDVCCVHCRWMPNGVCG